MQHKNLFLLADSKIFTLGSEEKRGERRGREWRKRKKKFELSFRSREDPSKYLSAYKSGQITKVLMLSNAAAPLPLVRSTSKRVHAFYFNLLFLHNLFRKRLKVNLKIFLITRGIRYQVSENFFDGKENKSEIDGDEIDYKFAPKLAIKSSKA